MIFQRTARHEPIRLIARKHNYFPQRFMWRGKQYNVHAVVRAWTEMKRQGAWYFFRVRCSEGTFDLCQDAVLNIWYLARRVE